MAVVVEPILTEEKLRSLLAEAHEQPCLDYKCSLDLTVRRDIVELAKDVAAMQSEPTGGYIVVGADDHGTPVPDLKLDLAKLFDEATLRPKLSRYLAEPFTVRCATHDIDGSTVALIYVRPSEHGWCIFKAHGEYEDPPGKKITVFRIGDVLVRHGTSSERWQDSDRGRLLGQIVARHREAWRAEFREELTAIAQQGLTARRLEELPSSAVTWQLDAEGFDQLVTELMRRGDDIPLRQMLIKLPAEADELLHSDKADDLATLLDRLSSVGALAIQYGRPEWLDRVLTAFVSIYHLGFDSNGYERNSPAVVQLWIDVVAHVYGLGSLAVRLADWEAVRKLAIQHPPGESFGHYGSWLRHALTMGSRANVLNKEKNAGLVARGHNAVRAVSSLRPDRTVDDEAILDSLCQFDLLGCLAVIGERGSLDSGNFYPSFAGYYSRRTEPAIARVISDRAMRGAIFDGDDRFLADALSRILRQANSESFPFGAWDGVDSQSVIRFIDEHRTPEN
jgi:Schlafen, AlbA_2